MTDVMGDSLTSSGLLGASTVSLSSSRQVSSHLSKTYKQASTLFLTRRLPESLSTLEPLVTLPETADQFSTKERAAGSAPIAAASRGTRIKVWSLYLTLLNAIIELGPENGKNSFGSKEWRNIVAQVRDGTIWENVVQIGYGGIEGNVDADVVTNLQVIATLLLSQSPSQIVNQQRLESYLSASSQPALDPTERFENSTKSNGDDVSRLSHSNDTNTPRDLITRIKILELYTLHVLPRNEEWSYARDFIGMSEVLDGERKDAFLQTLQGLEEEKTNNQKHEKDLLREREEEHERQRQQAEAERLEEAKARDERLRNEQSIRGHRKLDSEKDYGIDGPRSSPTNSKAKMPTSKEFAKVKGDIELNQVHLSPTSRSPSITSKKTSHAGMYKRSMAIVSTLQRLISNMAQSMSNNPMILLRTVLFLIGLILMFSRRDVKERIRKITGSGWEKVKQTVGMGVKVSYI